MFLRNSLSSHFPVYQTSSGPRLPYFLEKVSDTSFPRFPVFGGTLQDRFRSPPKLEKQSPNVPEERTGEVECEGDLEEPHRLENSESPVVERIVEP
jgi:hypothetical protein